MITFSDEVKNIWRSKFTGATALFFINRYVSLFHRVLVVFQFLVFKYNVFVLDSEKPQDLVSLLPIHSQSTAVLTAIQMSVLGVDLLRVTQTLD